MCDNSNFFFLNNAEYIAHENIATTIHISPLLKFKFNNIAVFIEHIKGYVELGETSIIIAVACKHRSQAYEFSRYIIEEIKKRTPIWKKEHYENKDSEWLKGKPIKTN